MPLECSGCFEQVEPLGGVCPRCQTILVGAEPASALPPSREPPGNARLRRAMLIGGAAMAGTLATLGMWQLLPGARVDADARQILERRLSAPASAKYVSSALVEESGDWRLVHVVVDSQNKFGAMLRGSYCVTYRHEGGRLQWNADASVMECPNPPTPDAVRAVKELNDWPGAKEPEAVPEWVEKTLNPPPKSPLVQLLASTGGATEPELERFEEEILGVLERQALDINRTLRADILDDQGEIRDPIEVLRGLERSMRRRGLNDDTRLRAWRRMMGPQAGSRIYHALQREMPAE